MSEVLNFQWPSRRDEPVEDEVVPEAWNDPHAAPPDAAQPAELSLLRHVPRVGRSLPYVKHSTRSALKTQRTMRGGAMIPGRAWSRRLGGATVNPTPLRIGEGWACMARQIGNAKKWLAL